MKRRILLVDDEVSILLTLKAVLELNGFQVETATSALEAGQKLARDAYHMVITDMRMESDTAGYDVIRFAKQQDYDPAIAILTAYAALGTDWNSRGAELLLIKPVATRDLLRQIEVLLIRHQDKKQKPSRVRAKSRHRTAGTAAPPSSIA